MNTKISTIILTKDESPENLKSCITSIKPYVDEVIIIDSDNYNENYNSTEEVSKNLGCKHFKKEIGDKGINGFNDLRNFGQAVSSNDWCLHVDVDEIFTESFFSYVEYIIEGRVESIKKAWAFSFPRINLPFYEGYPDYQTRFINKLQCQWSGNVHEKVEILKEPYEIENLNQYPIVHIDKSQQLKLQTNKRWKSLTNKRNILICSLFKNSEKYIDEFLSCLLELISYNKLKDQHKIDLCFIEGNSNDSTPKKLNAWVKQFNAKDKINFKFERLDLPELHRFESLAILRNLLIKLGLKSYHDYVLMIDSDTIFQPNLIEQLISTIEINQCDVIAPMPFIENYKDFENNYFYDTLAFIDNNNIHFNHYYPYAHELTQKNILKMTSVGTCYLAKAEIFNINDFSNYNIVKCYKEFLIKDPMIYEGINKETCELMSEQVLFFQKLKSKGYQVYTDTNIKIFHVNLEKLGIQWH